MSSKSHERNLKKRRLVKISFKILTTDFTDYTDRR
jgi:hypothetical protein